MTHNSSTQLNLKGFDFDLNGISSGKSRSTFASKFDAVATIRVAGGTRKNSSYDLNLSHWPDAKKEKLQTVAIGIGKLNRRDAVVAWFNPNDIASVASVKEYESKKTPVIIAADRRIVVKIFEGFGIELPTQAGTSVAIGCKLTKVDKLIYQVQPVQAIVNTGNGQGEVIQFDEFGKRIVQKKRTVAGGNFNF